MKLSTVVCIGKGRKTIERCSNNDLPLVVMEDLKLCLAVCIKKGQDNSVKEKCL